MAKLFNKITLFLILLGAINWGFFALNMNPIGFVISLIFGPDYGYLVKKTLYLTIAAAAIFQAKTILGFKK